MSIAIGVEAITSQRTLNRFLREFKHHSLEAFIKCGWVGLQSNETVLLLGQSDDHCLDVCVRLSDRKGFHKWLRAAGAKSEIVLRFDDIESDNPQVVCHCDKLGPRQFGERKDGPNGSVPASMLEMTDFVRQISAQHVRDVDFVVACVLPGQMRYALDCVMFDDGAVVATNGKSLACSTHEKDGAEEGTMVSSQAAKWACDHGFPIVELKSVVVCGNVIEKKATGRFPRWRQVVPATKNVPESWRVDAAELNRVIAQAEIERRAGVRENLAIDFQLRTDGHCMANGKPIASTPTEEMDITLDGALIKPFLPEDGELTIWFHERIESDDTSRAQNPENLPVILDIDADGKNRLVIMPMAKGR